ncbi:TPA: fimbrial protein [Providencia rettgeri]
MKLITYRYKFILLSCLLPIRVAIAQPLPNLVDDVHSSITINGTLVESTCTLDMKSVDQTIELGDIATHTFQQFANEVQPIPFQIQLNDCGHSSSYIRTKNQGNNLNWFEDQQIAFLSFYSEQQTQGMIKTKGETSGIALRIEDNLHRMIKLGEESYYHPLSPDSNHLLFYIVAKRTTEAITAGLFYATINFKINYE